MFLRTLAKGNPFFFDGQDYTFEGIDIANEVALGLLTEYKQEIEPDSFIFSQWQGYNFYYFINNDNNPKVKFFVEGDFQPAPYRYYTYDNFINCLTERIVNGLKLKNQLTKRDIVSDLIEIEKIRTAANTI